MGFRKPKASPAGNSPDVAMPQNANKSDDAPQQQSKAKVGFMIVSVFTSMFLVALDRTIISTAIPQITDEFNSLPDVGWYGSAYLLTCCSFQLLFGKFYTFWSVKIVLLISILLFEVGSVVCGAAPSSAAFIVGRAIAGCSAAGIQAGCIVCIVYAVPLEKRPRLQGLMGALFGLSSVVGPLIGGAFTSKVSWRWCFYINLPFAGVTIFVIAFTLQNPERDSTKLPWNEKLAQLDILGTTALMPGVICLLLAMQWGGQTYPVSFHYLQTQSISALILTLFWWNDGRIIALLTLMGVLLSAFCVVQVLFPKTATIPPRIIKQRSMIAGLWSTLCVGGSQYIAVYFLPVWFQSIKGVSAIDSGIRLLPLMMAMVVSTVLFGFTTQKIGYYTPFAIAGACIMSLGAGLLTTFQVDTSEGKWIGYQIIYGFGMGLAFQAPNLAAQTVLPTIDVPIGTAMMFFGQLLGASVIVSIGENVLDNQLVKRLAKVIPDFNPKIITSGGATSLIDAVPANLRATVLIVYNESLRKVLQICLILSCLCVLGSAALEWKSVLKKPKAEDQGETAEGATKKKEAADDDAKSGSETMVADPAAETARAAEGEAKEEAV